jgi:hypothetical protein
MTALSLTLVGIVASILTAWLVVIPAGVVVGAFSAFLHEGHGWKDRSRHA